MTQATYIGAVARRTRGSRVQATYFPFEGGWNIVDPPIEMRPGVLLDGENYEVHFRRGYNRCKGYERIDGQTKPSLLKYYAMGYESGSEAFSEDDEIEGQSSGATGKVLSVVAPDSGSFAGGDAVGTLILWGVSGTFTSGEALDNNTTATNGVADTTSAAKLEGESDDTLHKTYIGAASEKQRALISKVPGSGAVRGAWKYKSDIYAFRDNAGGTECVMHKATSSGWSAISLGQTLDFHMDAVELPFDSGSAEPSVGDLITAASGGTGRYRGSSLDSGTWGGGNAAGTMVLTGPSGSFANNDQLDNTTASSNNIATQDGDVLTGHELFEGETITGSFSGATGTVRRIITQSGSFQADSAEGYMVLSGVTGTFADDEPLKGSDNRIPFNSGSIPPSVGDVITGATSGASGTVREILPLDSGAWNSADADGVLVLKSVTGTFNGTENLDNTTTSDSNIATMNGDVQDFTVSAEGTNAAITLNPGGRYEFVNHNFGGHSESRRMYGADGKNNAFEFDGTYYVPIRTGMDDDTPIFIAAHKQHLFLAFDGGSLQHSSTGIPLVWSPVLGASELAVGEDITGLNIEVGDVLAVLARSDTYLLYGNNSANWDLRRFHQGSGGIKYTIQKMNVTWMMDDQGLTALSATEAFGDFLQSTVTSHIQPYIEPRLGNIQGSIRVRKKNQYRLYFDDKTGITVTVEDNQVKGLLKFRLDDQFNCMYSVKDDEESLGNETEVLLAGGDDGYVYELDSGPSFDGGEVLAWILPNYYNYGNPEISKIYRGLILEMDTQSTGTIAIIPEFNYGSDTIPTAIEQTAQLLGGGGRWNVDNWDEFLWSAPFVDEARFRINGSARNMAFLVISEATYEEPHILQGARVQYANRRLNR